jgi:hypothetical protein
MDVGRNDFKSHFEMLSDEALLETDREDLVEAARECYDQEIARRGLSPAAGPLAGEAEPAETGDPNEQGPVCIATYTDGEEASLARGLLDSAGIPVFLANERQALGAFQLKLMVPGEFAEQAVEILETEISEDDLAAQAEAAAPAEPTGEAEDEQAEPDTR